jgi:hypothetical protein
MGPIPLIKEVIKEINQKKGNVIVRFSEPTVSKLILENTTKSKIDLLAQFNEFDVEKFDAFINIRCNQNDYEEKNVDDNVIKMIVKH